MTNKLFKLIIKYYHHREKINIEIVDIEAIDEGLSKRLYKHIWNNHRTRNILVYNLIIFYAPLNIINTTVNLSFKPQIISL